MSSLCPYCISFPRGKGQASVLEHTMVVNSEQKCPRSRKGLVTWCITWKVKGSPFLNMVFINERRCCYVYSHSFLACRSPLGYECHHGERKVFTFATSSLPCASAFKMTAGTKRKSLLGGHFPCLSLGETNRGMLLRMLGCGEKRSSHKGAIHACCPELRPTYL